MCLLVSTKEYIVSAGVITIGCEEDEEDELEADDAVRVIDFEPRMLGDSGGTKKGDMEEEEEDWDDAVVVVVDMG